MVAFGAPRAAAQFAGSVGEGNTGEGLRSIIYFYVFDGRSCFLLHKLGDLWMIWTDFCRCKVHKVHNRASNPFLWPEKCHKKDQNGQPPGGFKGFSWFFSKAKKPL